MNSIAGGGTLASFSMLIFAGVDPLRANATSNVALNVGLIGSLTGYRKHMNEVRSWLLPFGLASFAGALIGAGLLMWTPSKWFASLAPFLCLFATLLFAGSETLRRWRSRQGIDSAEPAAWNTRTLVYHLLVSIYGGYFGAGIGILMLAAFGMMGFRDIHHMNALKTVMAVVMNLTATLCFVGADLVDWGPCAILAVGAVGGYYSGAVLSQKLSQQNVRHAVTGIGLLTTAALFWKTFLAS